MAKKRNNAPIRLASSFKIKNKNSLPIINLVKHNLQ